MLEGEDMAITTFRVKDEAKWEHQNRAEYTGDYLEGVTQDSYVLACKRGYAFVYARSKAAGWISWHEYKFAPYKDKESCAELWREWREIEADYEQGWNDYEEWASKRYAEMMNGEGSAA